MAKQYLAFWTFVAGGTRSTAYLKEKLLPVKMGAVEDKQVLVWIGQLNSSVFAVRERAARELRNRLSLVAPLLETVRTRSSSLETKRRIEALLAEVTGRDHERIRRENARRILVLIEERNR